jgi:hypothetical protein
MERIAALEAWTTDHDVRRAARALREAEAEAWGGNGPSESYEAWVAEGREPEPDEHDPGPEVDDEGGMSEYRYILPEDYLRGGAS